MEQISTLKSFRGFADSRIGGRSENQDSCGFIDTKLGLLVTVCDGMGGGPGGKTASSIAVAEIIKGVTEADESETIANILIKAIRRANMAIIQKSDEDPNLKGMGSTATALLINYQSAIVAHVGDSRIYQLRNGKKIFRTFDHSMVFELVKQKVITEEQARLSAQSNVITRALGIKPDLEVEVKELAYEAGDRFLLCTDGIHGTMPEKELIKIVTNSKISLGVSLDDLVTKVDSLGHEKGGGHDNLTAAIIETKSNSILKSKMSKRIKNIFFVLSTICLVSILVNIWQVTSLNKESKNSNVDKNDSIEVIQLRDSVKILKDNFSQEKEKAASLSQKKLTNIYAQLYKIEDSLRSRAKKLSPKDPQSQQETLILTTLSDRIQKIIPKKSTRIK